MCVVSVRETERERVASVCESGMCVSDVRVCVCACVACLYEYVRVSKTGERTHERAHESRKPFSYKRGFFATRAGPPGAISRPVPYLKS